MPYLSVIIPVYNAARRLRQCLDSILVQKYDGLEVLLIDDGSTDGSADICKEYTGKYPCFTYIHKDNGGASSARNTGIKLARGKWIFFIDADDVLPSDAIKSLTALSVDENADLIVGGYSINDTKKNTTTVFCVPEPVLNRTEAANMLFLENKYGYQGYIWNKLFRRSVIAGNDILFDEHYAFNEDRLFCVEFVCAMKGTAISCGSVIYNYIKHPGSTIGMINDNLRILDDYTSSLYIYERLKACHFPRRTVNLSRDNLVFSYDFIRHNLKIADTAKRRSIIKETKSKAIRDCGGMTFFIGNRLRRFLSRQINHIRGNKVYLEAIF